MVGKQKQFSGPIFYHISTFFCLACQIELLNLGALIFWGKSRQKSAVKVCIDVHYNQYANVDRCLPLDKDLLTQGGGLLSRLYTSKIWSAKLI